MALAIVRPPQRTDLALPAAGQHQEAHHRRSQWRDGLMRRQCCSELLELGIGQEPLPPALPVASQAGARVAPVRPVAIDLRLMQDRVLRDAQVL